MDSNITINIVEPGSTPIDPVVPNTGLFTSGIGGAEAAIIATVSLVAILAVIIAVLYYRKKQGKLISLKHKKAGLTTLALLVSIGTVAGLVKLTTSAIEGSEAENAELDSSLTVNVSDTELTIELADEPVFAVLPVDITVEEATDLGYTLTAFADSTNLVSTTDSSNIIPMVTVDTTDIEEANEAEELRSSESDAAESSDSSSLVPLSPNTYGLSFTDPESVLDEVFTSLSTDSLNPTLITDKDYEATLENDTTTIYYGFYITPDIPYGTYTGGNISVDAIPNMATVSYDANGLYFNDSEEDTLNTVGYKPNIAEAPIEEVVGEYMTPAPLSPADPSTTIHYTFLGWSEDKSATTPTYTNAEDILANLTLSKNESLTLYAVWHYDTVLSFNGTTSDGGTPMEDITIPAGDTITLPQNTYTREHSVFTGWNTVETPTPQDPGTEYANEAEFIAPEESADITLYAQWAYTTTITFDGNGETSGTMNPQTIVAGTPENLTPNEYTKANATFIGWNTEANGSGTSYSDEAEFAASTEEHQDITLYAQWAYTTISFNGNTTEPGTMDPITIAGGTTSNLPAKAFTKNNCIFTGWNTAASGTGISYGNSSPYTANATTIEAFTLYAQWQCISQVNYYGNGATSGEMASSIILGGSTLTFTQNTYARDGYIFNGWNTKADGSGTSYPDQGTFTAPMTPATTLNLYAQWLPTTTITFNGNDATSGTMSDQVIVAGTPQNLTPNAFAKDGYIFNGWNTVQTPTPENPGTVYADKAQYTASATATENVTLYAQWKQVFYMQDVATWGSTLSQGDTIEAVDKRDGQEYTVARLADNKIWMTQNLDLDLKTDGSIVYNATTTNISSAWTPTNATIGFTGTSVSGWSNDNNTPYSADPGPLFIYSSGTTSNDDQYTSLEACQQAHSDCSMHNHAGNYYNWSAAVAMNDTSSLTTQYSNAPGSICPAGWRLPTGRDSSNTAASREWNAVLYAEGVASNPTGNGYTTDGFNKIRKSPLWLARSGSVYGGSLSGIANVGRYWSSTVSNSYYAYGLYFSSGNVDPANGSNRYGGYSVRCIAQ